MKFKNICAALAAAIALSAAGLTPVSAAASVLYVSPSGSENGDGSENAPFATLTQARDAIRKMKSDEEYPNGGITVYVRGGEYRILETFELDEQDSGEKGAPVIYKAYPGETPKFIGGISISGDEFEPVPERYQSRLAEGMKDKIMYYDLAKTGITDFGQLPHRVFDGTEEIKTNPPELFFNGKEMTLARWPNEGEFAIVGDIVNVGANPRNWADDIKGTAGYVPEAQRDPYDGFVLRYDDNRVERWIGEEDIRWVGYWQWDWSMERLEIGEINTKKKTIASKQPGAYGIRQGQKYFCYNILPELDAPGEYYIDRKERKLFFYPPEPLAGTELGVSLMKDYFIMLNKTKYVVISGLSFDYSREGIIRGVGLEGCAVLGCRFENTGGKSASLSGCKNTFVANCDIYNTNGGIVITGGDTATLTPSGNGVLNNRIEKYDRIDKLYNPAVDMKGVGGRIAYNDISNADHMAIGTHTNDVVVEYNNIHDVLRNTNDAGAVYMYIGNGPTNFTQVGNVYRYNWFHNLGAKSTIGGIDNTDNSTSRQALYFDGFWGTEVSSNIFTECEYGIMINGGWGNKVTGNAFVNTDHPICLTDNNVRFGGTGRSLWKPSTEITDAYKKYDFLMKSLEDDADISLPQYNVIKGNAESNNKGLEYQIGRPQDMIDGKNDLKEAVTATVNESDFENYTEGNMQLKESFYKKNPEFGRIDFESIGLRSNDEIEAYVMKEIGGAGENGDEPSGTYPDKTDISADGVIALMIGSGKAYVNGEVKNIDEGNLAAAPVVKNGRTMVPLRFIAENFGAEVSFSDITGDAVIKTEDSKTIITAGSDRMYKNSEEYTLDSVPEISGGRMLVPVRAVAEAMGKKVYYDNRGIVIITKDSSYKSAVDGSNRITALEQIIKQ